MTDEISPNDISRWRAEGKPFLLLDIREPDELVKAKVDDALAIPMAQIPERIEELPKDRPIAVMCHHGGRSAHVVAFLRARGFDNAVNLDGGIDAYARLIEPSIPLY